MADTAAFTYQDRLKLSLEGHAALAAYADLFGRVERKLFAAGAAGARIADLKSAYLKTFGLTARQFNAIAIGLKGKIAAVEERRTGLIKEAKQRIAQARDVIARLEKRKPRSNDLHQKRRRLANLQADLDRLQGDHADGRAQFDLAGNGYGSHDEWLEDWQAARSDEVFVIGSKDETAGCQGCVASLQADGTLDLRLRLPKALAYHGRYLVLTGVFFAYGQGAILASLEAGRAISYRFRRDGTGWRVFATTAVAAPQRATVRGAGAIAVDINSDHLALAEIDRFGNLIETRRIASLTYGRTTDQAKARIGDAVTQVAAWAQARGKPIVIETLDFARKKAELESCPGGRRRARRLSGFAYAKIA